MSAVPGNPRWRKEDADLLTGRARFVDDLRVEGLLHLAFVRSPVAHARIVQLDLAGARAIPGVIAVCRASDLDLPRLDQSPLGGLPVDLHRPPLADGIVRFCGEPVAAIVGDSQTSVADAAGAVVAEYAPRPVVVDSEAALEAAAPLLYEDLGTNLVSEDSERVADILADAEHVISGRFVNQRVAAAPMEPYGAVVHPEPNGSLTVWSSCQAVHRIRDPLARALELDPDRVRIIAPHVGGGFGAKLDLYPELVVLVAMARRVMRPVKWVETRSENLVAMYHGRAQVQYVELGLRGDGSIAGLRVRAVGDAGAYPSMGPALVGMTKRMSQGPYRIPKIEFTSKSAVTNTTPVSAYRGAGRPEAAGLLERVMDMAATTLEIDPIELRKRNLLAPEAFPVKTVFGLTYDVGRYVDVLEAAARKSGYAELRRLQRERRREPGRALIGIGVSIYLDITPSRPFTEYAQLKVESDDSGAPLLELRVGTVDFGQGHDTTFSSIVAGVFKVSAHRVVVIEGDTALVPRGGGSASARSLQLCGSAVLRASENVLERAKAVVAEAREASVDDIVVGDGGVFTVAGVPASSMTLGEVATRAAGSLNAEFDFGSDSSFPYGAQVAVVEVDPETGSVRLVRHIAVDDCGRVINPVIVAGQQHGGLTQGIGQALYEAVLYDPDGSPITSTFVDYAIPSAAELPSYETHTMETPTPLNPLGAKGIGQLSTVGSAVAVQNAVVDALAHLGVRHIDMPMTAERVWRAIRYR